jgi:hypothetical protein
MDALTNSATQPLYLLLAVKKFRKIKYVFCEIHFHNENTDQSKVFKKWRVAG